MKLRSLIYGIFKGVLLTVILLFCALVRLRVWAVTHTWNLSVYEPAAHGGFGSSFRSETACNRVLQNFAKEAAEFKAEGRGNLAPVASCAHPKLIPW